MTAATLCASLERAENTDIPSMLIATRYRKAPPDIVEHYQAAPGTTRHHQALPGTAKHRQAPHVPAKHRASVAEAEQI